ncbi:MAG: phosphodiester glycosidase family protein, partial [Clostridia bacterium]|nr:phosphodiester glycosidase family protein [Clostridia bacterium]
MKFAKRLTALLIVAVMLISSCLFVNAAKATVTVNSTHTVDTGVSYSKLTVKSGQNGNTVSGVALEFNPADGYMPMVFAPYAGSANVLADYYSVATTKYGYDVAGIINGSFFDMDTSNLLGLNISNGKVSCAHSGYSGEVVAFDSNGKMDIVTSCLEYKLFIGGKEVPNSPIRYINKRYENDSWGPDRIFYYDTSCGTIADTTVKGYEVVCQKMNNSDLIVGSSLFAKVVSVGENTYGTKFESNANIESDKFVLFVKSDSSFAKYLKDLKAGDDIAIAVNETNPEAKEVMEKANSVITNVGFLVKDGVDRTRIDSAIGTHSVTLQARWTAFGQKADGSYVFLTTEGGSTGEGGSVTLRDVADYMISKGCVNVIRMDGGGSSAMYLKRTSAGSAGYAQYSSRKVTDGIMVVKKSSAVKSELVTALNTAIANAKASVASTPNASLSAAIAEAEAAVKKGNVVSGDARALIAKLSGKKELFAIATTASSASYLEYSEES